MLKKTKTSDLKLFLWFYGSTIVVLFLLMFFFIQHRSSHSVDFSAPALQDFVGTLLAKPLVHTIATIPYFIFLLIRRIIQDYKRTKIKGLLKGVFLKTAILVTALVVGGSALQNYRLSEVLDHTWDATVENNLARVNNYYSVDQKQRGIHVFNISRNIEDLEQLKTNNFEWITLTPFIDQESYNTPALRLISDDNYSKRLGHYKTIKEECDKLGIKIMLKPHIWLYKKENGKWRSDIEMETEQDWKRWFGNYNQIILKYAELAEELKFEQFCIGTELETTVHKKPEQWKALIQAVKAIYSGKLTYAANWNKEYKTVPFWEELDYIGIQAYFPLSETNNPTLLELERFWRKHSKEMELISAKFNKPILFTELGYKSIQGTAKKPWEWNGVNNMHLKISKNEQLLCYQAFFNTIWKESWFHGIHIWEWQGYGESDGNNTNFTIEGKPALNLIARYFKIN